MIEPTGYRDLDELLARLDRVAGLDADALEAEHTSVLGRKAGILTVASKAIPSLPPEERRAFGAAVNRVKQAVEEASAARRAAPAEVERARAFAAVDLSLPGLGREAGGGR